MFSLVIFLFPTVAMFYLCFVSLVVQLFIMQVTLLFLQSVSNSFPLFLIAWFFVRGGARLPSNVSIKVKNHYRSIEGQHASFSQTLQRFKEGKSAFALLCVRVRTRPV